MKDTIVIRGLVLPVFIGVPDEERAVEQSLKIHLELVPQAGFSGLMDEIDNAVNYYDVAQRVKYVAAARPRKLIETLAVEITTMVLEEFAVSDVILEIEKFILPDTNWVGLKMMRSRG